MSTKEEIIEFVPDEHKEQVGEAVDFVTTGYFYLCIGVLISVCLIKLIQFIKEKKKNMR